MDHLNGHTRPDQIPFVVCSGWEFEKAEGFFKFPEKILKGQTTQQLIDKGELCLTKGELNSFVQSWLFFGLLCEFRSGYDPAYMELFISQNSFGTRYITTKALPEYLKTWRTFIRDGPERNVRRRLMRLDLVLKDAKLIVQKYLTTDNTTKNSKWCVYPDVAMSIMVLGETLSWALSQAQREVERRGLGSPGPGWTTQDDRGWGPSHSLLETMKKRRWCPRSVYILQGLMRNSVSGLYYASTFSDPTDSRPGCNHVDCTPERCNANFIDPKDYKPRHIEEGCDCSLLQPKIHQIVKILEEDRIPLLRYIKGRAGLDEDRFDIVPYKLGMKYVVVSHVWSDGLGNEEVNGMVSCQIARLNEIMKEFSYFEEGVFFWIDSLMVPVGEERKSVRKKAIQKMFNVYEAARWTVVLDADLMEYSATDYLGPAMRITMSRWMQRLWTLQEGVMSKSIFFLFKNGLKDIEDLDLLYPQAASASSIASAARSFYLNLIRPRAPQRCADAALVSSIWKSIQWRQTTHAADETSAIARILNIYDEVPSDSSNDQRMEYLLRRIDEIPPGMIFLPGDRLSINGVRWAPKTWMVGRELEYPDPLSLPSQKSNFPQGYEIKVSYSHLAREGLMVRYPGFRLHGFSVGNPEDFSVHFPVDNSLQRWYNVKGIREKYLDKETRDVLAAKTLRRLAIICCRPPGPSAELALLVQIEEDKKVLKAYWLHRVFIQCETQTSVIEKARQDFKQKPDGSCWANELPPNQLWIVD